MHKLLIMFLLTMPTFVLAWDNNEIDTAWRLGKTENIVRAEASTSFAKNYQSYRLAMISLRLKDKKTAKKALASIESKLKKNYQNCDEAALYAGSLGLSIALKPWKATFIASESEDVLAYCLDQNPNHAPALMVKGIGLFNTPALFGGDKQAALELFDQAIQLYEQEEAWGYEDAWLWKIRALAATEQFSKRDEALAKARNRFPDFVLLNDL